MAQVEVPDRLVALRSSLAWVVLGLVVVLAVSGVYLSLAYRPTAAAAWPQMGTGDGDRSFVQVVRSVHRWIAWGSLLPATALAGVALAEAMARWSGPTRRRVGALAGPVVVVAVVLGLGTGLFLPWDQLALRAITVGTDYRGYDWLLGDDVRFVLRDGLELSVTTVRAVFAVHVLAIPAVAAIALGALVRRR
ncbi:hypothetical protein ACE2AJ_20820 [Aquihabitans daechungensis]|uniref:hypothetical protein n=1 Tax=Aquihabitans daechungensis TaxID=1052257 RepID=UPI003B9F814B